MAPGYDQCMFICMLVWGTGSLGGMELRVSEPRAIGDEEIADAAPRVRALVLERLELVWETCRPHLDGTLAQAGERVDPRFVEAGIRVCDRLSRLYRLDAPAQAQVSVTAVVDPRALVEAQMREVRARMDPDLAQG